MSQLAPSILAADFNRLGEQIRKIEENGVKWLHIDVMDGRFVPSISFGMPLIESIRKESGMIFDVHLMIKEPGRYIQEFARCGADSVTVHVEACGDVEHVLAKIRSQKLRCGISLNPETPVEEIEPYLGMVDMVLVMSVHPGFGGQKFIPESLDKVKRLVELRRERELSYSIEIDGGVNLGNMQEILASGVDITVAGTAVFRGDIPGNIARIREVMADAS